jgi:arylsulfatase A-like enzyme
MAFRTGKHIVFTGAGGPNLIEEDRLTLPSMLRKQGYHTAMVGKWHVGLTFLGQDGRPIHDHRPEAVSRIDYSRPIPDAPIHRGFDHFFGTACCPTTDWLYAFIDGDRIPVPPQAKVNHGKYPQNPYTKDFRDGWIAPDFEIENIDQIFLRKSLSYLEEHVRTRADQPFFLFHSTQAIHLPSIPAAAWQGKTGLGAHADFITQLDDHIGALLDKLNELGLAEDTIVILTSDNGPEVDAVVQMRKDHQHDGAHPWRGIKRDQWEGGHRVPLIVRWPEKIKADTLSDQTVCLTDLMATAAEISGYALPNSAAEDSYCLTPILFGKADQPVRPYTLHQTWGPYYAIRMGSWKYLDHAGSGGNDYQKKLGLAEYHWPDLAEKTSAQLYDLAADPGEKRNLILEQPQRAERMKALLHQSIQNGRSAPMR